MKVAWIQECDSGGCRHSRHQCVTPTGRILDILCLFISPRCQGTHRRSTLALLYSVDGSDDPSAWNRSGCRGEVGRGCL